MGRLLDEDDVIAEIRNHKKFLEERHAQKYGDTDSITDLYFLAHDHIEEAIKAKVPPVTLKRKTGKWIERNPQNSDKCRLIECDQCGFAHIVGFNVSYEDWVENRNFCERCGADMRGEGGR